MYQDIFKRSVLCVLSPKRSVFCALCSVFSLPNTLCSLPPKHSVLPPSPTYPCLLPIPPLSLSSSLFFFFPTLSLRSLPMLLSSPQFLPLPFSLTRFLLLPPLPFCLCRAVSLTQLARFLIQPISANSKVRALLLSSKFFFYFASHVQFCILLNFVYFGHVW